MIRFLLVGVAAFAAATILTGVVRRYALTNALLDYPNDRSSHSTPTPRGGGLAIALVVLGGLVAFALAGSIEWKLVAALGGGGGLIALIGWLDDRRGVPARVRLAVHLVSAVWTVAWLGGLPTLDVGLRTVYLGAGGTVLAVLGIMWAINLYNFMDGIDGLAAGQAVIVGLAAAALLASRNVGLAAIALLLAAAAGGFLVWNWAPARIFMGDIGSCFLGYQFAALGLASEKASGLPALVWLMLFGVFFTDATVTLLRKVAKREPWHAAHRLHAFQRAVHGNWSHRHVTLAALCLTAILGALAWLAVREPSRLGSALAVAATVLGLAYLLVEWRNPMPRNLGTGKPLTHRPRE